MEQRYEVISLNVAVFDREQPVLIVTLADKGGKVISFNTTDTDKIVEILSKFSSSIQSKQIEIDTDTDTI